MSYESRDPAAAQEVTGALIQAYMAYRTTAYTLQYPKQFFDSELARVGKELDYWTTRREAYMPATKTVDLGVQGVQDVEFMRSQKLELAKVDQDLAQKRAALQSMKSLRAGPPSPEDLPFRAENENGADNMILELKKQLAEARTRLHS